MRFALLTLTATASLLVGCSQPATPPTEETVIATETPAAGPATTPSAAPATAAAIPEPFRGVWDNAEGNCNPASDLRMEIGAVSIEFYESLGTVTGVTVESPDSIVVDLAMEGEGERWTVQNRYALSDDGQTLTPSDAKDDTEQRIPRKRCAN